jgi:hypothetical protein
VLLYNVVLDQDLGPIDAMRAQKPKRLPSVLTKEEVHCVLGHMSGMHLLMAKLLYGANQIGILTNPQKHAIIVSFDDTMYH